MSECNELFFKYVGRLMTDAEHQQKANRVKKRKLRALRREVKRCGTMANKLLAHLDDGTHESGGECSVCSMICCPHGDILHFHHDGCPSCSLPR
jgi:hypothetical protein